ncbi:MAG: response regulator transcription factor [Alphaproteobacteria bacterium]|nr:response regulator transcription factor [Alphaproteobacteria bacterium]MBV9372524.1 response regulator transcription factor [Alphaproteobacteria bacterium]MBV9902247.1 response regulator transcription factor [Alphaproteobacteria bacterium]
MIRVFAADDESLALDRLRDLVGRFPDLDLVGSASSGKAALDQIVALRPDAVLLDIEMPLLDGFDVVESLARGEGPKPLIVFVTAFPHFAATAFDTGAIDFLTKPVRLTRLETAMQRVRQALVDRSANERLRELAGQLETLRRERNAELGESSHLWVQSRGESIRVDLDKVERVAAEGEYVRLFVGEASYLHRESVTGMADRLNPQRFLRIHRSNIVDRGRVVSVRRRATGSYQVVTDRGVTLPVGRSYRGAVRTILARGAQESA